MDFLGKVSMEAEIYEDSYNGEMVSMAVRTVTAADTLELSLLANGGAGIYITRKLEPLKCGVCTGYMSDRLYGIPGKGRPDASRAAEKGGLE